MVAAIKAQVNLAHSLDLVHHPAEPPNLDGLGVLAHETQEYGVRRHVAHSRRSQRAVEGHLERVDVRVQRLGERVGEDLGRAAPAKNCGQPPESL